MTKVRYVRVYADADGESHFSDEEMELKPVAFAPPAPPVNLSAFTPAKQMALLATPAGLFGDWHRAPHRQFFFRLAGEVEIQVRTVRSDALGRGVSFL